MVPDPEQERPHPNRGRNPFWAFEDGAFVVRPYGLALLVAVALVGSGGMIGKGLTVTGWLGITWLIAAIVLTTLQYLLVTNSTANERLGRRIGKATKWSARVFLVLLALALAWDAFTKYQMASQARDLRAAAGEILGPNGSLVCSDGKISISAGDLAFDDALLTKLADLIKMHPLAGEVHSFSAWNPAHSGDVDRPGLSDACVNILAEWDELEFVMLQASPVSPEAAEALADLPELKRLHVAKPFPPAVAARIEAKHPHLEVWGTGSGFVSRRPSILQRTVGLFMRLF